MESSKRSTLSSKGSSTASKNSSTSSSSGKHAIHQPTLTQSFFSSKRSGSSSALQKELPTVVDTNPTEPHVQSANDQDKNDSDGHKKVHKNADQGHENTQVYSSDNMEEENVEPDNRKDTVLHGLNDMFIDLEQRKFDEEVNDGVEIKDAEDTNVQEQNSVEIVAKNGQDSLEVNEKHNEIPPVPKQLPSNPQNSKKRTKKFRKVKGVDEFGYMTIRTEEIWETDDEHDVTQDSPTIKEEEISIATRPVSLKRSYNSVKKASSRESSETPSKPTAAKKRNSKKEISSNQGSLMSFFKKEVD